MIPIAIVCGGLGTRLGDLTATTPKSLVDVNGQPFILRQLDLLKSHGYTNIVLCTGHLGAQIRDVVGNGARLGMTVEYSHDGAEALGTAGAVRQALRDLGERFFVLYGDSYLDCDYALIERFFLLNGLNVSTWWQGIDYGLTGVLADDLRVVRVPDLHEWQKRVRGMDRLLFYPMPQRFEEIGSLSGLERVRRVLAR